MSTNCIWCVVNKRTGIDLLCDTCRAEKATPATDAPTDATAQITAVLHEARADGEGTPTTEKVAIGSKSVDATGEAGGPPEGWQAYAENLARKLGEMTKDRDEQASAASYNLSMQEAANRESEAARITIATLRDECAQLREWSEYAQRRFTEETGKDLQAQAS